MRCAKGFTLPEVTLGLAITAVLALLSGAVIVAGLNGYVRSLRLANGLKLCGAVQEFVAERLTYGSEVVITDVQPNAEDYIIKVDTNGRIYAKSADEWISVLSDEVYGSFEVEISVSAKENSQLMTVFTEVTENGESLCRREITVRMMNFSEAVRIMPEIGNKSKAFYITYNGG